MNKKRLVHGSTFSGIGAPEIASSMLGWENAFHCEINEFGRSVLDYYYPNAKSYEDITKTDFTEWRGKIDVLTGGFPCQPFSYAGKRRGTEDDRYLWPFMLKCINEIRPTWFIGENVGGISTMVFPGEASKVGSSADIFEPRDIYRRNERYVIEEICKNLECSEYSVQPMLIPACAVGAPHRRDRIFFIAHRNEQDDVADTSDDRWSRGRPSQVGREWETDEWGRIRPTEGFGECRTATDTNSRGLARRDENREQCDQRSFGQSSEGDEQNCVRYSEGWNENGIETNDLLPQNRWRTFPSVSSVYRGNDGFPFDVDNLTIPFSRWKKESLKAYGNAIVVQVMYEIFRAIDIIENQ